MTVIAPSPHSNNGNNGSKSNGPGNGDGSLHEPGLLNNNEGLLTLQEIAQRLDVGYGRLRGFAGADGIGELLGAVDVPGVKGVRYEPRAVEAFRRLTQAQDAKQVIPATATAWLEANQGTIVQPQQSDNDAAREIALSGGADLPAPRGLAAVLGTLAGLPAALVAQTAMLRELAGFPRETRPSAPPAQPAPPTPDRLLNAAQAAARLACSPRAVWRYVDPVLPGKWLESDLDAFLAGLKGKKIGKKGGDK